MVPWVLNPFCSGKSQRRKDEAVPSASHSPRSLPIDQGPCANGLLGGVVRIACGSPSAALFPSELRANFRLQDLTAELGTPEWLWAVCSGRGRDRRLGVLGSLKSGAGRWAGGGPRAEAEAEGGADF